MKKIRLTSAHLIPLSFLAAILIGTVFLALPISSAAGNWTPFTDALFTATTSVCVTGLVVKDTYQYWSHFGQVVILVLIQVGGIGVITAVSTMMMLARKRFSLSERLMLRDAMNLENLNDLLDRLYPRIRNGQRNLGLCIHSYFRVLQRRHRCAGPGQPGALPK